MKQSGGVRPSKITQESTLCGKSIIKNFRRAKQLGYTIELHYVGVDSAETAKQRVEERLCLMDGYDRSSFFHCCPDCCTGNRIP